MRMPAATETLKESTMPAMGMLHRISDAAIASSLTPLQHRRNSLVGCWTIQSTLTQPLYVTEWLEDYPDTDNN